MDPEQLMLNGGILYWVNDGGAEAGGPDSLMRMPAAGGTPVSLVTSQSIPAIAADATSVFFASADAIMSVPAGGGALTTLASAQQDIIAVSVDSTNVYWAAASTPGCVPGARGCGAIMRVAKTGGVATTIASGQKLPTNIGGQWPAIPMPLTVDRENVYWIAQTEVVEEVTTVGTISKAPIAGGPTEILASGQLGIGPDLFVYGGNVYWSAWSGSTATEGGNRVFRTTPIAGGGSPAVVPTVTDVASFKIDKGSVYWVNYDQSTQQWVLHVAPLGGGASSIVADWVGSAAVVVDGGSAYWTDSGYGPHGRVWTFGPSICQAGQCRCPENQTLCFGRCVDEQARFMLCGG